MNKTTKGILAVGASAVLLAGGAGTLALWNSSQSVDAGTISSGTLTLTQLTAGVWTDTSADAVGGTVFDPATDLIVPGDTLSYTQTFLVAATGKNLSADLTADLPTATGVLADHADLTATAQIGGVAVPTITSANDGDTVTVTVGLNFDITTGDDPEPGDTAQNDDLDLSDMVVTLQQVRP